MNQLRERNCLVSAFNQNFHSYNYLILPKFSTNAWYREMRLCLPWYQLTWFMQYFRQQIVRCYTLKKDTASSIRKIATNEWIVAIHILLQYVTLKDVIFGLPNFKVEIHQKSCYRNRTQEWLQKMAQSYEETL